MNILPQLKWVGGKRRIVDFLLSKFPAKFNSYYEPFLGGGAVLLAYLQSNHVKKGIFASDINPHLICWWDAVKNDLPHMLNQLNEIKANYDNSSDHKNKYFEYRNEFNQYVSIDTYKAALFTFLSTTAFNGLVRYDSKGNFNASWGNQLSGNRHNCFVFDKDSLANLSLLLRTNEVHFSCSDYTEVVPQKGDFVFSDPPYLPIGERSMDKLAYDKSGFGLKKHENFAQWNANHIKNGVFCCVCNHDTPLCRELYPCPPFTYIEYALNKSFSGRGASRKATQEILIFG